MKNSATVKTSGMKTILCLCGLAMLMATAGCEVEEEHGHRGGAYGPAEYGHGEYHYYPGHRDRDDWDDRD